jgi:hypothetical protein
MIIAAEYAVAEPLVSLGEIAASRAQVGAAASSRTPQAAPRPMRSDNIILAAALQPLAGCRMGKDQTR